MCAAAAKQAQGSDAHPALRRPQSRLRRRPRCWRAAHHLLLQTARACAAASLHPSDWTKVACKASGACGDGREAGGLRSPVASGAACGYCWCQGGGLAALSTHCTPLQAGASLVAVCCASLRHPHVRGSARPQRLHRSLATQCSCKPCAMYLNRSLDKALLDAADRRQ